MQINLIDPGNLGGGQISARSQTLLEEAARYQAPLWSLPIQELRTISSAANKQLMEAYYPPAMASVRQIIFPGPDCDLQARVYTPPGDGPFPLLVYFHGGGFVLGALDDFDAANHILACNSRRVLFSVDYRLAPEYPFPAAHEDCYSAYLWAYSHAAQLNIDPTHIAVAGDSAGGNLTAAVTLMCRDRNVPLPEKQIMIYPVLDLSSMSLPSYKQFSAYGLSVADCAWFRDQYAPNPQDWSNPYLSPFLAEDLSGLPSALVITAEFDVLRDEGEAYARRLEQAGVPVNCSRYLGMRHGFAIMPGVFNEAQLALDEIVAALA